VLGRGYAIARREDGTSIASVQDTGPGDKLKLTLSDGSVDCRVL
jgi:exodeoxyribonuclease VII large subunit